MAVILIGFLCLCCSLNASYVEDLEEQGYCVIPEVISAAEAQQLYLRIWHEYIEKAWPNCKLDDRSNWKEAFPKHNKVGIFAGYAGQIQAMWDVRQDPRIIEPFAKIWNTHELIVSMDGFSVMCPPEIREGFFDPWPHVDQSLARQDGPLESGACPIGFVSESSLKTSPYTIQGQILFEDSSEGDGGFYCIPKSHLCFDTYASKIRDITDTELPLAEKKAAMRLAFKEVFENTVDESGSPYCMKHITAPRGSLILWDSRTVHWNQHARSDGPNPSRVRMCGFVCYVPKSRLTEQGKAVRKSAFESAVCTGHDPANPMIMDTRAKGSIPEEYEKYLVDPSYTPPQITLTPLGESLLGF